MESKGYQYSCNIFNEVFDFDAEALRLWKFYLGQSPKAHQIAQAMGRNTPFFLPIRMFETGLSTGKSWKPEAEFRSSGTSGAGTTSHFVRDISLYQTSLLKGFQHFYGSENRTVFALLPNYIEKGNSSLVYMVRHWMEKFGNPGSGFFLENFQAMEQAMVEAMERQEKILLIGVSYALLDFAEKFPLKLAPDAVVMETGGMKGRRREMVRHELHAKLGRGFGLNEIHSEYGMTELLSQAYSLGNGRFRCPPWMRVVVSDLYLPEVALPFGQSGRINIIDLANAWSHPFLATDDIGRAFADGSFEVLGRIDRSQLRGCNLLYA